MMMARQVVSHAKETPKGWINQAGYGTGTEPVRNRYGTGTEPVRNRYGTGGTVHWLCYCATVLRFCPEDSAMAVLPAGCSVTWHCTTNFILKQTCELMWETWEMQLGNLDIHPWNIEVDTDMQKYFYVR